MSVTSEPRVRELRDEARPVRQGEGFDVPAVHEWLRQVLPELKGLPEVTQYTGGASNWTYRLHYPNRDLILRRPPAGTKAKSAHDMGREYRIQKALAPVFPHVPTMVAYCEDDSVVGAPFYVMERVQGIIPRAEMPPGVTLSASQARQLCSNAVDTLVALHAVDAEAAGLASLGKGPGYARRQIEGWIDRYERARTYNVPRFDRVKAWLRERIPEDVGACVIHNDYRLDNLVLAEDDPTRIVAVLDWEMATIGDPLMEVGATMAYWVQADDDFMARKIRRQPSHLPGMYSRREFLETYAERSGRAPDDWRFYEVYGLFRLATIAQQIYYRYHHKQTRNPAFRSFWLWVHYVRFRCWRVMQATAR